MIAITRAGFASIAAAAVMALTPSIQAIAQVATPPARAASPATTQVPARATGTATVITIDREHLTAEPPVMDPAATDSQIAGARLAAPVVPGGAGARPGTAGTLTAPPPGRLNVTLTPRQPAAENRAYLSYSYPHTVYLSKADAYVMYSKNNMPGHFGYTAHVKEGRRYLIEIGVRTDDGTGNVIHSIGGNQSTHAISTSNAPLSAIVIPSADGWVSGTLREGNNPPGFWHVRSVKISEMD